MELYIYVHKTENGVQIVWSVLVELYTFVYTMDYGVLIVFSIPVGSVELSPPRSPIMSTNISALLEAAFCLTGGELRPSRSV